MSYHEDSRERISQTQASYPNPDAPKKNHLNALLSRGGQEESSYVITDMLQVLSINVYALIDLGSTLSFLTPLVAREFNVLPDALMETFSATTPVGDSIVARIVFRIVLYHCPIMILWLNWYNLIWLTLIMGMDWLHACFASIDCITRVVKFQFSNKPILEWKGGNSIPRSQII